MFLIHGSAVFHQKPAQSPRLPASHDKSPNLG